MEIAEEKVVIRSLPVRLGPQELRERSIELAQVLDDAGEAENEKKAAQARFSETIERLKARSRALGSTVKSGVEHRQVECEWRQNVADLKMELHRTDTGEVIESRPMTKEERQVALFPDPFGDEHDAVRRKRREKKDDDAPDAEVAGE